MADQMIVGEAARPRIGSCENGPVHPHNGDPATFMPRILIIDDDRDLTQMLAEYLGPEGFVVETAPTGEDGLAAALGTEYALIILDVMLPQINGLEVLRRLRTRSSCPVIMLTARGQDVDRIVGLEIGADDYLAKPFNVRELLARLHAVLRRTQGASSAALDDVITVGDVVVDVRARTVRCDGAPIEVTSLEFDVLRVLLASAGEVVLRERLFEDVLRREYSVFDRSVDNHVSSLRRKLGPRVGDAERIKSVRNAGYVYARTPRTPDARDTPKKPIAPSRTPGRDPREPE
jgi:two-component system, OmpR family, response regulator CpxR